MSESGKAVFLSYASQDAEAAKRICDALRAVAVEVWFDRSELVGGDAWDQKIRKQIKECALLIPIISENTQARTEGYFRLEWRLADQRTHLMAKGRAFLLPVSIDGTRDDEAHVPDSFTEVQWTKAAGGEVPPAFVARVKQLLEGSDMEAGRPRPAEPRGGGTPPPLRPGWKVYAGVAAGVAVLVAVVGWWMLRGSGEPAAPPPVSPAVSPDPNSSEVLQLVARARALQESLDSSRDDFKLAEDLLEKARQKDDTNAEVWAGLAQLHGRYFQRGWDMTKTRREAARVASQRALRLDPRSYEARLAAVFLLADNEAEGGEKVRQLQELRREQPRDQRLLRALATVLNRLGKLEEADALNDESAALPGGDPLALYNKSLNKWFTGRTVEAEQALEACLAQRSFTGALLISAWYAIYLHGDVARAREILARIPPTEMQYDRAAYFAYFVEHHARQPDAAIARLQAVPRDWINDGWYRGPKALLIGDALQLAGRNEAAIEEWRKALRLVDERLAAGTADDVFPTVRIAILAKLGQRAEAEKELVVRAQRFGYDLSGAQAVPRPFTNICILLGKKIEAIRQISRGLRQDRRAVDYTAALLRAHPFYDPLRDEPEFAQVVAEAEKIEQEAASAASSASRPTPGPGTPNPGPSNPAAPDSKSVAVLAFANLSDDKANEYFSDGISEELLNVLAKVPGLKVSARTSAFYFKGRETPIPEIARKLGVAYVIEGSVRKQGNQVRITAQLIKAADGFHVWSETYDRELKDIFAVQDEIAKNIFGVVKGSLLGETELPHAQATKIEAYTLFLQAQGAFAKRGETGLREAIRLFEAALAIDPGYVPALVGLAQARVVLPNYAYLSGPKAREMTDAGLKAARRALELEPRNAAAHAVIGWAKCQVEWQWDEAEAALLRARDLAPNDHWVWNCLGDYYRFVGDIRQALVARQRQRELDPLSPSCHWDLSYVHLVAGNRAEAIRWAGLSTGLSPHNVDSYMPTVLAAAQSGQFDLLHRTLTEARRNVREGEGMLLLLEAYAAIVEKKPAEARRVLAAVAPLAEKGTASPAYLGYCHLLLGDAAEAVVWLQRGYDRSDPAMLWNEIIDFEVIAANPLTRPLLAQPRLKELYELRQRHARAGFNKL